MGNKLCKYWENITKLLVIKLLNSLHFQGIILIPLKFTAMSTCLAHKPGCRDGFSYNLNMQFSFSFTFWSSSSTSSLPLSRHLVLYLTVRMWQRLCTPTTLGGGSTSCLKTRVLKPRPAGHTQHVGGFNAVRERFCSIISVCTMKKLPTIFNIQFYVNNVKNAFTARTQKIKSSSTTAAKPSSYFFSFTSFFILCSYILR